MRLGDKKGAIADFRKALENPPPGSRLRWRVKTLGATP